MVLCSVVDLSTLSRVFPMLVSHLIWQNDNMSLGSRPVYSRPWNNASVQRQGLVSQGALALLLWDCTPSFITEDFDTARLGHSTRH